jgi:hypothetical protein
MVPVRPTPAFARSLLDLATIRAGTTYQRIARFPDPLGFGKTPSRFSDPRRRNMAKRFGVLYLGTSLKVCFIEAILKDRRNGSVADYPIEEAELTARNLTVVEAASALKLVDLRGDGPVCMGIPRDAVGAASQKLAQAWPVAFHEHAERPDGIIYPSRLNEETNIAVYDRAITKLACPRIGPLMGAAGLASVLNSLRVALV